MRQPGSIQLDLGSVEDGSPRPGKRQPDHRAEPDWRIVREVVEDEIAQAIDDGVVLVPLDALGDVWMCTDDGVRASVDQPMRQSLLPRATSFSTSHALPGDDGPAAKARGGKSL